MNNIGYNLFCYAENNPINNNDMNGNAAVPIRDCTSNFKFPTSKPHVISVPIRNDNVSFQKREISPISKSENKNKLPTESLPNTTLTAPNGNKRVYGSDGKALKDIDYSHPHHHPELGNPHIHDWTWNGEKKVEVSNHEIQLKVN